MYGSFNKINKVLNTLGFIALNSWVYIISTNVTILYHVQSKHGLSLYKSVFLFLVLLLT